MIPTAHQLILLQPLGRPYVWNSGGLISGRSCWPLGNSTTKSSGRRGWECSHLAQEASVQLGTLRPDAWQDIRAHDFAYACDPVDLVDAIVSDLVFYKPPTSKEIEHMSMIFALGGAGAWPMVIEAAGGGSKTHGSSPRGAVRIMPIDYRSDRLVIGRIKGRFRPATTDEGS